MDKPFSLQWQQTLDERMVREQAMRAAAAARRIQELFHTDAEQYRRDFLRFSAQFRSEVQG
jgi:hypothetical protein